MRRPQGGLPQTPGFAMLRRVSRVPRMGSAWWERHLEPLRADLSVYVRTKLPALVHEHDDLVQEALLGLTRELKLHRGSYPSAWWLSAEEISEADRSYFRALAFTILNRRISDLFARGIKRWSEAALLAASSSADPTAERRHLLAQIAAVVVETLAQVSPADRVLLGRVTDPNGESLPPRDRQRLHRLRLKLLGAVRDRLGANVHELLGPDR